MRGQRKVAPKSVDEYLASVPADMRPALQNLRKTIREAAPEAEEVISYQMPAFRHHGMLVYYAAFKDHCSFFVGSSAARRKFAAVLKPFAAGKGTVHFTPQRPLPAALVKRIVKARVAENEARAQAKRRTAARTSKTPR
ncbi:MAG: iron chaperone [Methanobacteriota archaeon]